MNNKTIIISTISLLLISFTFLSWTEKKQADINTKNIWMIYFANPKDNSLDFIIENHSSNTTFDYKVLENKNILKQESINVKNGETKNISVTDIPQAKEKLTIEVSDQKSKKEIYKSL